MKTDEWLDIEHENASPGVKAALAILRKQPLVLKSQQNPRKTTPTMSRGHASLKEELGAFLPEYPDGNQALRDRKLAAPPSTNAMNRFVRSAREAIPAAAQMGVSSSLIANANKPAPTAGPRQIDYNSLMPNLALSSARDPAPEPGMVEQTVNALNDIRKQPSRLDPRSPGFAEGAGAAIPHLAASLIDPAGAALGGAAFKLAAPVVKGAVKAASAVGKRIGDIEITPGVQEALEHLLKDESGQARPWQLAKEALDLADDAFEEGGQAIGRAAGAAGTAGKMTLNSLAARTADHAQKLGDVWTIPKHAAENAATAISNRIALKGRTGKTADEWYEAVKNNPAVTRVAGVNALLDKTRRGWFSDQGMTPEMKAIREDGRVWGVNNARPVDELALMLNKERTGAEQHDIHWQATEQTPPPSTGPMNPQTYMDAMNVRRVSRDADQVMEGIGALPTGVTAAFDGTHLPRGYAKWWLAEGKMKQWDTFIKDIPDNKIGGFYERGLDDTLPETDFLAEQASAAQTGRQWREVSRYTDPNGNVMVNAHRDWTISERQGWGEIRHASSGLQRKAEKIRRDGPAAYVLNEYARPGNGDALGEFARPVSSFGPGPHRDNITIRNAAGVDQNYVLIGDALAKQSGIPKYGRLANHYVRDDVAFHLWNQQTLTPLINNINKFTLNTLWKKMVTIGNFPGYFVNNFFQNPLILERTGGTMADMPKAWEHLASNSIFAQRLEDAGVIRNGVLARELGAQMKHFNATLSSQHMHSGFSISKNIFRAMNALQKYENNAYKLAGASDDLYRVTMVEGLMRREKSKIPDANGHYGPMQFEEAAEIAKHAFYDSQAVNSPAAQIASTVAPFAKVMWWAADNEIKAWTKNPGKAAYIDFLSYAGPIAASYAMGKSGKQQDAEQQALPENMQGHGNSVPLPYNDGTSNYHLDTSNWNARNMFKPAENTALSAKMPVSVPGFGDRVGLPRGLMPGGVPAVLGQLAFNTDAYTGKPIVDPDADGNNITDNRMNFLARSLSPGIGRNAVGLYDSMLGQAPSTQGAQVSTASKALRYVTGVKTRPADIAAAIHWNTVEREFDERKYDKKIKAVVAAGDESAADAIRAAKENMILESQKRYRVLTQDTEEAPPEVQTEAGVKAALELLRNTK